MNGRQGGLIGWLLGLERRWMEWHFRKRFPGNPADLLVESKGPIAAPLESAQADLIEVQMALAEAYAHIEDTRREMRAILLHPGGGSALDDYVHRVTKSDTGLRAWMVQAGTVKFAAVKVALYSARDASRAAAAKLETAADELEKLGKMAEAAERRGGEDRRGPEA